MRGPSRGFTIMELMIVVMMIGILAMLAIPSIRRQLRDRRNNQAAHEISLLYRTARARAIGRGGAVLVRFSPGGASTPRGRVEVFEAINAGTGSASSGSLSGQVGGLPATSCQLTTWTAGVTSNGVTVRSIASFDPSAFDVYSNVRLAFFDAGASSVSIADVCFSPLGRALARFGSTSTFTTLAQVPYIEVAPVDSTGRTRTVLVMPDGSSRLTL